MANSNVLVTGKIGIGTTSPNARLDVAGDVNVSIGEENGAVVVNDGVNGTHVLEVDNDGAMKILFDSANA